MNKLISIQQIHPLKRALASLNIMTKQRFKHLRDIWKIKKHEALYDHLYPSEYSDNLSYTYKLFDCREERSLYQFQPYTDREFGGQSAAQLYYDREDKHLSLAGEISANNKDKLEQHPSIGIALTHPYRIKCGPFNALQVEIQSDGEPMHVGVQLQSQIQGVVGCYGILTSRVKGWNSYELPFQNMLVVGAENGPRHSNDYGIKGNSFLFFDRQAYDARRILLTQSKQPIIRDINIRLLSNKSIRRHINIRSINLVRRSHCKKFLEEYKEPFFFIAPTDPYLISPEMGVSWLEKGYNQMSHIDLGDKIYKRSNINNTQNRNYVHHTTNQHSHFTQKPKEKNKSNIHNPAHPQNKN